MTAAAATGPAPQADCTATPAAKEAAPADHQGRPAGQPAAPRSSQVLTSGGHHLRPSSSAPAGIVNAGTVANTAVYDRIGVYTLRGLGRVPDRGSARPGAPPPGPRSCVTKLRPESHAHALNLEQHGAPGRYSQCHRGLGGWPDPSSRCRPGSTVTVAASRRAA